jgi:hypothetical protein
MKAYTSPIGSQPPGALVLTFPPQYQPRLTIQDVIHRKASTGYSYLVIRTTLPEQQYEQYGTQNIEVFINVWCSYDKNTPSNTWGTWWGEIVPPHPTMMPIKPPPLERAGNPLPRFPKNYQTPKDKYGGGEFARSNSRTIYIRTPLEEYVGNLAEELGLRTRWMNHKYNYELGESQPGGVAPDGRQRRELQHWPNDISTKPLFEIHHSNRGTTIKGKGNTWTPLMLDNIRCTLIRRHEEKEQETKPDRETGQIPYLQETSDRTSQTNAGTACFSPYTMVYRAGHTFMTTVKWELAPITELTQYAAASRVYFHLKRIYLQYNFLDYSGSYRCA